VDLLDVLGHPGFVGSAFDERRLGLGALDPLLDVVDEQLRDLVRIARDEEGGEVVVGVDPRAGDHLEPGLLGNPAHEPGVASEQHRGRVADRLHPGRQRLLRCLDRDPVLAARWHGPRLTLPDGLDVWPLDVHGLVAGDQVLVDQRRAELADIDRPGDGLHPRHR
jgi:hypothetical protein